MPNSVSPRQQQGKPLAVTSTRSRCATQDVKVFDSAGIELTSQMNQEDQRIVLALVDPIATPGEYLVTYAVTGIDGDFTEESFTFRWQEGAPEPAGITVFLAQDQGFDYITFGLLLVGAALAAFLAVRFITALREHRAAQAAGLG